LEAIDYIYGLNILGGEPFIHKDIAIVIQKLLSSKKIGSIGIITNGTILPDDDTLKSFAEIENAYMYISNYGEKSSKAVELADKCQRYSIPVYVESYTQYWTDEGGYAHSRNYSTEQMRHLYAVCGASLCTQLYGGKLYACARVPVLNEERLIPYDEKMFLDTRAATESELQEALHSYLYDTQYLSGCQFCDGQYAGAKNKVLRGL
jgi:hypothetical protein